MSKKKSRLIIVDVSNFIFRAFYAIRVLHSPEGVPVNAVHGILSMFLKLFSQYRPTHVLLAKDTAGGSFRNEMYKEYKANRSEPPEELIPQFALIQKLIEHMGLTWVDHQDYEADDVIGSAAVQWKSEFDEILIASGDKDLMQFVSDTDGVKILDTMKDRIFDEAGVKEKMGVRPDQIVDYLSIVGDTSDNVPGMKGIGAKGAAKLLEEHGTLDKCIEVKDTFKGKKLTNAFENHLDDALLSRDLVKIVTDFDLGVKAQETEYSFYPNDEMIDYLKSLGFKSAIKRLEEIKYNIHKAQENESGDGTFVNLDSEKIKTEVKTTVLKSADELLKKVKKSKEMSLHIEFDSDDIFTREVLGVSVSVDGTESLIVYSNDVKTLLEGLWGDSKKTIYTHNAKSDLHFAIENQIEIKCHHFDTAQIHFILKTTSRNDLKVLAENYLHHEMVEVPKKTPYINQLEEDLLEKKDIIVGEKATCIFQLAKQFTDDVKEYELGKIYSEFDAPMLPILAKMEHEGVLINAGYFKKFEKELQEELDSLNDKINKHSSKEVNLNSPKQVGEFLFEELALPVVKKTKTGFSTDSSVLEELDAKNVSEVPGMILKYREIGKILSTYVKAIPLLQSKTDKKVHTHFNLNVAATGRLSSTNPNLQNIPIRSELGKKVRKGFIASPGNILLAADYSQVELRLLAHFAGDETMLNAFNNGDDIHAQTASEVLGVPLKDVTSNERSKAKAVNFGLMYGQSSFGLAKALKISRKEAKAYIETYFERFNKVKAYLDGLKDECEKTGYAITMHGRKRFLPDIHSQNRTVKANAERVAINSPIQGTASDIIKLAMIKISKLMEDQNLKSKMILQVHDELIFDVPEDELAAMKELVREGMESVVKLKVPLSVDMGVGVNWYDLK